jgi:para-nitrobenzyl esterase
VAVAFALALVGLPVMATSSSAWGFFDRPPVVLTHSGAVRGVQSNGMENFLGIRYAQPPLGALRWRPPQPVTPWRGVADATHYGGRCAALKDTNGPTTLNEDCLFVNVQRPIGSFPGEHLPVYVWIHGGSLLNGGADQHSGDLFVHNGAIVVTMNYRLGMLGFLAHPALTAEGGESGNYGFQDQQASLRWIHDNIAAFGGDPRRVTIGGESAGATAVCAHMAAPGSRGLFSSVVLQSAVCPSYTAATADFTWAAAAAKAGCPTAATVLTCLRAAPVQALLDATPGAPNYVSGTPTLPIPPETAIKTGNFARVPVLTGTTVDEGRTFTSTLTQWTKAQYESIIGLIFPATKAQVLARYPWPANDADPFTGAYALAKVLTDSGVFVSVGACPGRRLAQTLASYVPVYTYEFDNPTGPGLRPVPGYVWGAGHAADLPYTWPSFNNGTPIAALFNTGEKELSSDMTHYWGSFVAFKRPLVLGQAFWPRYNRERDVLSLRVSGQSQVISDASFSAAHQCSFWDANS